MIFTQVVHTHVGENFETVENTFEGTVDEVSDILAQLHEQELEKEMDKHLEVKCGKNELPDFIQGYFGNNNHSYSYASPNSEKAFFNYLASL